MSHHFYPLRLLLHSSYRLDFYNCALTRLLLISVALSGLFLMAMHSHAEALTPSLQVEAKTQAQSRKTQQRVDQLSAETQRLLASYQRITQQLDYQQAYTDELKQKLSDQDAEVLQLEQAIADIQITRLHLLPLLREMTDTLRHFIQLDLPFEQQARLRAVDDLDALLANSQVSIAEKFQRLMELYQTENDYNYSLASYTDVIDLEGAAFTVEFLRLGRMALYYRSLDGEKIALWSPTDAQWLDVSEVSGASRQLQKAIRVAQDRQAPELLQLPLSHQVLMTQLPVPSQNGDQP